MSATMSIQSYLSKTYEMMTKSPIDDKGVLEQFKQLQDFLHIHGVKDPQIFTSRQFYVRVLLSCVADKAILQDLEKTNMADGQLSVFLSNMLLARASYDNTFSPDYLRGVVNVITNNRPNQPVPMLAFAIGFILGRSLYLGNENAIYMADLCNDSYIGSSKKSFLNGLESGFNPNENGLFSISNYIKKLDERYESWGSDHRRFCYRLIQLAGKYPNFDITFDQPKISQSENLTTEHERISWFLYGRYPCDFTKSLALKYFHAIKNEQEMMTVKREVVKEIEVIKEVLKEVEPSPVLLAAQELSKFATFATTQMKEQTKVLEKELEALKQVENKPLVNRKMI